MLVRMFDCTRILIGWIKVNSAQCRKVNLLSFPPEHSLSFLATLSSDNTDDSNFSTRKNGSSDDLSCGNPVSGLLWHGTKQLASQCHPSLVSRTTCVSSSSPFSLTSLSLSHTHTLSLSLRHAQTNTHARAHREREREGEREREKQNNNKKKKKTATKQQAQQTFDVSVSPYV